MAQLILPLAEAGGFNPPWVRDIAKVLEADRQKCVRHYAVSVDRVKIFQVVKDLFYHRNVLQDLAHILLSLQPHDDIVTTDFRDATELGRYAIQILEFFDRVGLTRRVKERRLVRNKSLDWL